jgi:prevent-host-death family protein
MSATVSIFEAKSTLSRLVAQAEEGHETVLTRYGRPVAVIGPVPKRTTPRTLGALKGRIQVAPGWDAFTEQDDRDWYGE